MRYLAILAFCTFCILKSFAQVSGRVVDSSGSALSFATVSILSLPDSTLLSSLDTDSTGKFTTPRLHPGNYVIRISFAGFQPQQLAAISISTLDAAVTLGDIPLKRASQSLREIVIHRNIPQILQKPEGLVVQAGNSVMTRGSTVLRVLERSPGVVINPRDNAITLNGKTGVQVMLNGRQLRLSENDIIGLLSGMNADDIASIELLDSPGAKYDADGSAGIINITTKKYSRVGTYGNISFTAGYGYRGKLASGSSLSHVSNKTHLWISYNYAFNSSYSDMYITGTQSMPVFGGDASTVFHDTTNTKTNTHNIVTGAEYKFTKKTTLGINLNFSSRSNHRNNLNDAYYNILPDSMLHFRGLNKGNIQWKNLISSLYAEHQISTGSKLSLNADFLFYHNESPYQVESFFKNENSVQVENENDLFAPAQQGYADSRIQVLVGKVDYSKKISDKLRLETGFKGTWTTSCSISGMQSFVDSNWTSNPLMNNNIGMNENISAGYAIVTMKLDENTNVAAGLRYEYSITEMRNKFYDTLLSVRKLGVFFPDIFLTRRLNENSELQISYTKRISRPAYNDLASYVSYSDPTAAYTGNPFLQPAIIHNLKFGYSHRTFSAALIYSRESNAISRYQLTESVDGKILFISPQNLSRQEFLNLQITVPVNIGKWWLMNYGFTGGYRAYRAGYTRQPLHNSYFGYSANANWTFKFNKRYSFELSGFANSNSFNGTVRQRGFAVLNAGIKKEFNKQKGILQLTVEDIFTKQQYHVKYGTLTEEVFNIKSNVTFRTESARFPIFRINYSIPFGNNNAQRKEKNFSAAEQERIIK
ncbi:TonB-dependent receptor [Pollutibacter soli]|uniref:TonB-dependent receptor n=1 Tax=Pollutibacter soli TaxID=3034157 RepID=UPI003013CA75